MKRPTSADTIDDRFELERLLGEGATATVWEATDRRTHAACVVKLYPIDIVDRVFSEYLDYLRDLHESLRSRDLPGILLPIAAGRTTDYVYHVFPFLAQLRHLTQLIASGTTAREPAKALVVLAKIAEALSALHADSVVHADLKPANVLVSDTGQLGVYLMDFGMARAIESDHSVLITGTPLYMHPDLGRGTSRSSTLEARYSEAPATLVGPYIDIYSCGLIGLEMLVGTPTPPKPLTQRQLSAYLGDNNATLATGSPDLIQSLAELLLQMLTVRAKRPGVPATTVQTIALSLSVRYAAEMQAPASEAPQQTAPRTMESALNAGNEIAVVLRRVERELDRLSASTATFLAKARSVEVLESAPRDEQILHEVSVGVQYIVNSFSRYDN